MDFNGSFLARVRDLAGANPIILVVTKVILVPIWFPIKLPMHIFTLHFCEGGSPSQRD